ANKGLGKNRSLPRSQARAEPCRPSPSREKNSRREKPGSLRFRSIMFSFTHDLFSRFLISRPSSLAIASQRPCTAEGWLTPHPAFGHPLPRGEGQGMRGRQVNKLDQSLNFVAIPSRPFMKP